LSAWQRLGKLSAKGYSRLRGTRTKRHIKRGRKLLATATDRYIPFDAALVKDAAAVAYKITLPFCRDYLALQRRELWSGNVPTPWKSGLGLCAASRHQELSSIGPTLISRATWAALDSDGPTSSTTFALAPALYVLRYEATLL